MMLIALCVIGLAVGIAQPEHDQPTAAPWENLEPGALVMDSDDAGVHNLRIFYQDQSRTVLSGSLPHGDAGFETLAELGVKTVISVDAARPELEKAEANGLRYIHIPIKYSGITEEQRTAIALALAQSEGTVYVHCHHGKHRGPAAAAIGLIGIGACTPEDGRKLMERAGTSASYTGLWDDVAHAGTLTDAEMVRASPMIVEYARIEGLPAIMAEMDRVYDHLAVLSKNDWQAPENHPDLSAESEAGQLTDLFRTILADSSMPVPDETYAGYMTEAAQLATTLETQILGNQSAEAVITIEQLKATCSACHKSYR
ncbi:MAG: hypothetical protein KDA31_00850 [Phycisphaerales bacterium]|nr:hypothetical protein [Phycisphaerales bacterium]MCB9837450.1 hypothetical protein [Phycisphaera sp.]